MEVDKCRNNLVGIMAVRDKAPEKYHCYTLIIAGVINSFVVVGQHGFSLIDGAILGDTFSNAVTKISSPQGSEIKAKLAAYLKEITTNSPES